MGALGLSVLLLAVDIVEVWLVVDCMSSLDVESVSVSPSGLELVDFCDWLIGSLNSLDSLHSVDAGEAGLDLGMASALGFSLSSSAAEWLFMAMRWVKKLNISSGVTTDGFEMVIALYVFTDGLVMVLA